MSEPEKKYQLTESPDALMSDTDKKIAERIFAEVIAVLPEVKWHRVHVLNPLSSDNVVYHGYIGYYALMAGRQRGVLGGSIRHVIDNDMLIVRPGNLADELWLYATTSDAALMEGAAWSREAPTVAEVKRRHDLEGQSPRWWWRSIKNDHHGNERQVLELRVLDGVVHWLYEHEDRFWRYEPLPEDFGGEWSPCEGPK